MPRIISHVIRESRPGPGPRAGRDLAGQDLRGLNLRGEDLQGADLRHCDLREADLRGADLFGARLEGSRLEGCRFDMTRLVEIHVPEDLNLDIVNQIRHFDFARVMTRFVGPNRHSEDLPCPYRNAALKPVLYEWGSRTWNKGAGWNPPTSPWTLEEIIAAVLDAIQCRHDFNRPCVMAAR